LLFSYLDSLPGREGQYKELRCDMLPRVQIRLKISGFKALF